MSIDKTFSPAPAPADLPSDDRLNMPGPDRVDPSHGQSYERVATEYEGYEPDLYAARDDAEGQGTSFSPAALRERAAMVDQRVKAFVRNSPLVAIAGAVAAGFVIGRIASRS